MVTAVRQLDLVIGDLVEIAGRRYEVVPDWKAVSLLNRNTQIAELDTDRGTKPASAEDFERLTAAYPSDGEG